MDLKSITKIFSLVAIFVGPISLSGQELQFHYDFRDNIDPQLYEKNFPWVDFKYFKEIDTVNTGALLFEVQSFLNGNKNNIGQTFIQISQSLKFWKPNIFAYFYYSGGLGVTPNSYGYYISNAYSVGGSYLLAFKNIWFNLGLLYRYSAYQKPSHDPQLNLYIGGALFNYKVTYSSTLVLWSNNKDDGSTINGGKNGKKVLFFADPQIWFKIGKGFSIGSRGSLSYHIVDDLNRVVLYPTIGVKRDF
ncbi:MAG: DUF5020 family protein [Bacteroidota bacterium]